MTNLTCFDYLSTPVRVIERDGEPWFVLADVCRVLVIANPRHAATRLDDEDKDAVVQSDAIGRDQTMTVISEGGLYDLVIRSDKPEAKPFRKWVTGEVLPSIRKHGAYIAPSATTQGVAAAAEASGNLTVAKDIYALLMETLPSLGEAARQGVAASLFGQVGITVPHPVVEQTWQMTEIAEQFDISPQVAGRLCAHLKSDAHGDTTYTTASHTNKLVPQFRWNATGRAAVERILRAAVGPVRLGDFS